MKKRLQFVLLAMAAAVTLAVLFAPSPLLNAQQPADQAVTKPDHLTFYGDVGTCNEGETEYNMLTHVGKRCGSGGNVWWPIPAVAALTTDVGKLYGVNASGLPVIALAGDANLVSNTVTGLSAQRVCHVTYSFAVDAGTTPIVPAANCVIPINAVITNLGVQATTAVTAAGSATVAVGCVGGTACGATALMAATAKASLGTAAFGQSIPVPQTASTWVKTTAATGITLTVAVGPLTAGILEVYVFYYVSST
jgi:hypothetical protein